MDTIIKILENSPTITGDYDREADVLYISLGEPREATAVELGDGVIARYDEESQSIVGITLIGLRQRVMKELNSKLHVAPREDGWAVTEETVKSAPRLFPTLADALKYAVGVAKAQWLEVVVYGENGEIQEVINPGMDALLQRRRKQRKPETDASANLAQLCQKVVDDGHTVIIKRAEGESVALIAADKLERLLIAADELERLREEVLRLLQSSKQDADRSRSALEDAKARAIKPQSVNELRQELGIGEEG